jgi:hypothetical protein
MKYINHKLLSYITILSLLSCNAKNLIPDTRGTIEQITLSTVDKMPNHPTPYKYRDWKENTLNFDKYVFDFNQKGNYLPLVWLDGQKRNFPDTTFGIYTALGDIRMGSEVNNGENHEALGALGAVLGATMVGIDKSDQDGRNYVKMLRNYFNKDNGWNVIMNFTNKGAHIGGGYGNDFWYEVHNNVLFYSIADFYKDEEDFDDICRTIADQFYLSDSIMGDNYSYSYCNFKEMKGYKSHIPTQEDVAGGYAFILYSAWVKFGDDKYLKGAKNALDVLHNQRENRFYEAMMPIAAHIAARMNAEHGTNYNIGRFLNWTFNGNAMGREGWGVIQDTWGDYDVSGMLGSTVHAGGYGFLMNTFDLMLPLSTLVRYDQRYSNTIGKWALNASNAARFCYPYELPDSLQAIPQHKAVTKDVIGYEGIIKESIYPEFKGITPFAQGDGPLWHEGMPQETMFSVYGSAHVGFFGSIISETNVSEILKINCTIADFYSSQKSYETYLYYNPYDSTQSVQIDLGPDSYNLYELNSRSIIKLKATGIANIEIPAESSVVLVLVPSSLSFELKEGQLCAGDIIVDYRFGGGRIE